MGTRDMDAGLFHLTAGDAGRLMQARKLSPVELLDAFLSRIEAVDGRVKSYLLVTADAARDAARQAEADIMAGRWRGLLHGIPYAVKDNYYTRGVRTCAASRLLMDFVPEHDAAVVEKLDGAGAVMLGKLNTWEYGTGNGGVYFDLPFDPACNPWALDRFTGGSSTGAGASVAAGTAMIAMGSDTTGSVRLPAAACGLQGMKPTYGLVSRYGILPNCYSMDTPGPLTWTVEDSAIVLRAVAGHDSRDPASGNRAVPDYLAGLEDGVRGMTIGVIRDFGAEGEYLEPANREGLEDMVRVLRAEGARVIEVTLPAPIHEYRKVTSVINWTESMTIHEDDLMKRGADMGFALRDKLMSGFMTRAVDYLAAQRRRRELADATDQLVRSVDALIAPCAFHVAPRFADNDVLRTFTSQNVCPPFNASGHPAMTVCTGFDADGLPTNAQVVGRWFDEATVFKVARAYERATSWRDRRPVL
ncbi:glutamyl-tRNA(Gln) amidotransferase subunit A [Bordetella ansorpii]|uniref:Glutamyl-tRNA(Gln) amidotransferase subunit A n=2 Tax=Bordetella ansorpii TaxID=288768 RepID=A0A157KCR5_9BORD|nr:glutamyl-tRNA(Gln) amidotransferase subunit A [Bordetella ansorpii]